MLFFEVRTPGAFASRGAEKRCDSKSRNEKDNVTLGRKASWLLVSCLGRIKPKRF